MSYKAEEIPERDNPWIERLPYKLTIDESIKLPEVSHKEKDRVVDRTEVTYFISPYKSEWRCICSSHKLISQGSRPDVNVAMVRHNEDQHGGRPYMLSQMNTV